MEVQSVAVVNIVNFKLDIEFPIQFFCHSHTPQHLFILDGKEVGGLLLIILVLKEKNPCPTL
jgi:hypothetical protein